MNPATSLGHVLVPLSLEQAYSTLHALVTFITLVASRKAEQVQAPAAKPTSCIRYSIALWRQALAKGERLGDLDATRRRVHHTLD